LKCKINVSEHETVVSQDLNDYLMEFNQCYANADQKYLGLHQEQEFSHDIFNTVIKSHYYIGYRWLNEHEYICVSAKKKNGYKADYLAMLLKCLDDPIVSKHLEDTYQIFFDQKWIKIQEKQDEITPLIVLHFLKSVKKLSQKGLKKGYISVTENLTSKIKGKILINQTIKHNHLKNRLDKTVCNHQVFTINCLENQIIKTALMQCGRHLRGINNEEISKLLRQNVNSFEMVDSREVFINDFSKIKHSPFYKEYQDALKLAKMIFKRFGFTLNSVTGNHAYKIPPFYINMPELFERYVEVNLRAAYPDLIDGNRVEPKFEWSMRPDFLLTLEDEKFIIDAKYKYWFENSDDWDKFKDDYQQLSLYGRAKRIRQEFGLPEKEEVKLVFIYPSHDESKDIVLNDENLVDENFEKIYKIPVYIPSIGE